MPAVTPLDMYSSLIGGNKILIQSTSDRKSVNSLPIAHGIYLFYGDENILLYIGKSKNVRARVRSHFTARDERWLTKRVKYIEVHETAGELGALLLESRLIKELHPMYNVRSKQKRRIIIARRVENKQGYATIKLEEIDYLLFKPDAPILGIFKHKTQAKEFLNTISKTHRLCPKLLLLEKSRDCCFSFHLGQCNGACVGEEDVAIYNARVNAAFEARKIIAWPFDNAVIVEEVSRDRKLREVFVIDNWCLMASYKGETKKEIRSLLKKRQRNKMDNFSHRFDYDSYKILYSYLVEEKNRINIKEHSYFL